MDIIKEAIAEGKVKSSKAFKSWCKEVLQKPRPQNPLAKLKKKKGHKASGSEESALVAAIRYRPLLIMSWYCTGVGECLLHLLVESHQQALRMLCMYIRCKLTAQKRPSSCGSQRSGHLAQTSQL